MIASKYDKRCSVLLYRDKSEIYKRNDEVTDFAEHKLRVSGAYNSGGIRMKEKFTKTKEINIKGQTSKVSVTVIDSKNPWLQLFYGLDYPREYGKYFNSVRDNMTDLQCKFCESI